ncbi:MAG TPA: dephospho-CoA kinase [Acholeplasmataceae bacterium]|nr:dephospho-CoA kinase [Acholeplasmataceae bacterium]HQC30178.1 dephospho-CoA kinase [Acholeplasmataceae bacterium]
MSVLNVKNKRPFIIGLTGGIATGKSSVSNEFRKKGLIVVDSDKIVHHLWQTDMELNDTVSREFKLEVPIDKKRLAKMVFNDPNRLARLNELIHPKVFKYIDNFVKDNMHLDIIIIDMPLLFEAKYNKVDLTLLVYSTPSQQLDRLVSRDKMSKTEAQIRIDNQMPINKKLFMADYVIYNNDSKEVLEGEINKFIEKLGV